MRALFDRLGADGFRVLAVATKREPETLVDAVVDDESELVLAGFAAFLDPPKASAKPALQALAASGVAVKIITGDNEQVARHVFGELGIPVTGVLIGAEIGAMNDDALRARVEDVNLFARANPQQKNRVLLALKARGHVVGYMGDGINDAPSLHTADVGISVDSAVDVAKQAAAMILLENDLNVLYAGIREGRRTFGNVMKYIMMATSSNFGNMFSMAAATLFLPFLPMLPLHLLIQNLLYDVSQVAIPFDNVDDEQIQKPQRWNPADLGRFMIFFGPISSIFDILTFCLMWFVFHANTPETQTLFQSGWFVVGLLSQTLIVHMIRTRRVPFIQSCASWPLMIMTVIVMIVGIALPFSPLASYLQLQALPLSYFPWLVAILAGYMTLTQLVKGFYSRRYGWQ